MRYTTNIVLWAGLWAGGLTAAAQVKLDMGNQGKNYDFSNAPFTRPVKSGAAIPATCTVGELFYKVNAAPGANLYGCTAVDTWSLETGGGVSELTFRSSDATISTAIVGNDIDFVVNPATVSTNTGNNDLSGANRLGMGATGFLSITLSNDTATGTAPNRLAILTGTTTSTARTATTSTTSGVIGVVGTGSGTSGSARIAVLGTVVCEFDGATTAANYVQASATVAGQCHDAGASRPVSGQVLGLVLSTNAVAGSFPFLLLPQ